MFARTLLILACALSGCRKPAPTNRVARQISAPRVANDPNLANFLGAWVSEDGGVFTLTQNADGSATIALPPNTVWEAVVNHVWFDGPTLRYDCYQYYKGDEDFTTRTNSVGDHPYSGVRNEVTLSRGDAPNTLKERVVTRDIPQGVESVLRRRAGQ